MQTEQIQNHSWKDEGIRYQTFHLSFFLDVSQLYAFSEPGFFMAAVRICSF